MFSVLLSCVPFSCPSFQASAALAANRPIEEPVLTWGDYNRDGLDDVYATNPGGEDRLLRNAGDGSFEDVTSLAGLEGITGSRSATWGDYDRDGWVDLFVPRRSAGRLMRNLHDGRFEDRTRDAGLASAGAAHDARWFDYDRDGYLDLVLQGSGDSLFHNRADGTFDVVLLPGIAPARPLDPVVRLLGGIGSNTEAQTAGLLGRDLARAFDSLRRTAADLLVQRSLLLVQQGAAQNASGSAGTSGAGLPANCANSIKDQATDNCFQASSAPRLGLLYPISANWYVSSTGNVGIGTTTPGQKLTVAGVIESTSGGVRFPDGSTQTTALIGGGVAMGSMILGTSQIPPSGYSFAGLTVRSDWIRPWTSRASMPTARTRLAATVVNGKIYAIGGMNSGGLSATVEEYDPTTDTWTTKALMPTARFFLAAATANGKIYALGGYGNNAPFNTVEEFDPATNTWMTRASMPTLRAELAASEVDGRIYVMGGTSDYSVALSAVDEYDPTTDSWTTKASMPTPRWGLTTAAVNGRIYAIGNSGNSPGSSQTVEEYDPATNTWSTKAAATGAGTATTFSGKIYVVDGIFGVVEEYDPVADQWIRHQPLMTIPRNSLAAASVNGRIYALGGSSYSTGTLQVSNAVEEFVPGATLYLHLKN